MDHLFGYLAEASSDLNMLTVLTRFPLLTSYFLNISNRYQFQITDNNTNTNNNNTKHMAYCDKERLRKAKIEMKRERKAARVLGIITGAFIVCWLPFFLLALISPFCPSCDFHPAMFSVCLWLGYLNSLLNPIIYTIFNPSFRNAFRKLIFKRHRRRRW